MAANFKALCATRSNNTGGRWSLMCSVAYLEYRILDKAISLTATLNRCHQRSLWWSCYFEQIGSCWILQERHTFLSCNFRVFKHGTTDLEQLLYPANNMIRLELSPNLPTVKGLIQSASPINHCFIA